MTIEQIYTGCLAQGAYYIRSRNEAVIIDPLREVDSYIEKARNDGATIKYILETHFHADFVSGHLDLAAKTGATIVFGPTAAPKFKAHIATDGEELKVGNITFKVLHTPGHTMESTTYLLKDEDGNEVAIFTGDTLFLGDVGRPDLAQKAAHLTKEQLAGLLFDSLHSKIIPLADSITVYPAHGAGSACGKNMSKETVDTLGHQKQTNYALRASMSREEFINEVTDGLQAPPAYFPENVRMNKEGYESIDKVIKSGTQPLTTEEFELIANETGALILDTRSANDFRLGFIPNSINIGIEGSFAPWVGALIPGVNQPLLIISDKGREEEVVTRLARVGYDNTLGYLKDGFESWVAAGKETDTINSIAAVDLSNQLTKDTIIIDVRKQSEFQAEHVEGAINLPLDFINDHLAEIPKKGRVFVHCAGGYRSMIAISILKARGWDNLIDVSGGFKAIAETTIPRTNIVFAK
jgi:glyoxylase-like metal-dependent hydrolase (beta-lactamase superfamily II)/rhodanese-related sulfurtransferase